MPYHLLPQKCVFRLMIIKITTVIPSKNRITVIMVVKIMKTIVIYITVTRTVIITLIETTATLTK